MDPTCPPDWLLRTLPANAGIDPELMADVERLGGQLPDSLPALHQRLVEVQVYREYDAAASRAGVLVWQRLDECLRGDAATRRALLEFAQAHLPDGALARLLRRIVKDQSCSVRRRAQRILRTSSRVREVALPAGADGAWDQTGWLAGLSRVPMGTRHEQGTRVLEQNGLPVALTVGQLREVLGLRSAKQLGYFLLASDANNGPYTSFTIPKRDGRDRTICAPKWPLRWVQRTILAKILSQIPPHEAAHGFVPGRSTVTNAEAHLGARLLVKFDLKDFFPSVHYCRVVGLFTRLGYPVQDARFATGDDSRRVAATLARLCCYTPDPGAWHLGHTPQGAPTSPAISNLVCRRLDARLTGLATKKGGVYTRYADDLTFSFRKPEQVDLGRFRWWVDQICQQEGFLVNQDKFRAIRSSQRQVVTGVVVNDVLRVPRPERRRFRAILHNCRRHGLESQARGHRDFVGWLRGYAAYINMVHPEEGADLLRQVAQLVGGADPDEGGEEAPRP